MKIKFLLDDGNTWKATHFSCKLTLNTDAERHYSVTELNLLPMQVKEKKKQSIWTGDYIIVQIMSIKPELAC